MATSSFAFGPDSIKQIVNSINASIASDTKQMANVFWSAFLAFLAAHLLWIIIFLVVIFAIAILYAVFGRWGLLGSVLYNTLYLGILLIVGLIWGPDVFISDIFHAACTVILYPICFFITGLVLDWTGLK
jgi:hypothetical protein